MQNREQRRREQDGNPGSRFALDGGVHGAAHHRLFDEGDGDTSAHADEEQAGDAGGARRVRRVDPDAQASGEEESGTHARRGDADRTAPERDLPGTAATADRSPHRVWS